MQYYPLIILPTYFSVTSPIPFNRTVNIDTNSHWQILWTAKMIDPCLMYINLFLPKMNSLVSSRPKIRCLSTILGKILLNEMKWHYWQSYGRFCIFCHLSGNWFSVSPFKILILRNLWQVTLILWLATLKVNLFFGWLDH